MSDDSRAIAEKAALEIWGVSRTLEQVSNRIAAACREAVEQATRGERAVLLQHSICRTDLREANEAVARARAEADALRTRVKELEASILSHFQRQHLEGDGPEIDRWRGRVERLEAALRELIRYSDIAEPAVRRAAVERTVQALAPAQAKGAQEEK